MRTKEEIAEKTRELKARARECKVEYKKCRPYDEVGEYYWEEWRKALTMIALLWWVLRDA